MTIVCLATSVKCSPFSTIALVETTVTPSADPFENTTLSAPSPQPDADMDPVTTTDYSLIHNVKDFILNTTATASPLVLNTYEYMLGLVIFSLSTFLVNSVLVFVLMRAKWVREHIFKSYWHELRRLNNVDMTSKYGGGELRLLNNRK